ncbi:hypothetical protein J2T09_003742 [Neorhizobium huautlense]|uniref:Uncharacterized protein n=1 Tax=Neorhizobium huautlense TaxID=67774 RepID=A0ABT9PXN3_9HYPH|nr:hypothetical protein [Neorhizobium huautlense]MDP9838970.1 hypothetical protein [Neorhizobium huautlense]
MRKHLTLLAVILCASNAQSAEFLDGAYGNKEGCTYASTGESSGADVFFLLNDEGVTTAASFCEFKSTASKTSTGFTIKAQCDAEGEIGPVHTMTLTKSAMGYTITARDGTKWGPLPKCR